MNNVIGKRIYELRAQSGMTQTQLAEKLSVTFQAISKWEKGKASPDIDSLILISDIFGVSTDYLLKGTGKECTKLPERNHHWAVAYTNKLIAPVVLSDSGEKKLLKTIEGHDKDEGFTKECILAAFHTYVRSEDPNVRGQEVVNMLSKLGGVIYNESLGPVDKQIRKMAESVMARSMDPNRDAVRALKQEIKNLLMYECDRDASEHDKLVVLNSINETYLASSNSAWSSTYRIREYLDRERAKQNAERREQERKKRMAALALRIMEGYFPTGRWPATVDEAIKDANERLRNEGPAVIPTIIYGIAASAIRLMVETIPSEVRPVLKEGTDLKDYADQVYGWLGRRIGKDDASYVISIAGFADETAGDQAKLGFADLDTFSSFMDRLFKKYQILKRKGL